MVKPSPPWLRWIQPALDAGLIFASFALAWYARYRLQWFANVDPAFDAAFDAYVPFAAGSAALLVVFFSVNGVYAPGRGVSWIDRVGRILNGATVGLILLLAVTFFFRPLVYSRLLFFEATVLIVVALSGVRLVRQGVEAYRRRHGFGLDRVLIVGAGEVGRAVMRTMVARADLGYQVIGYLDDDPERGSGTVGRFKGLGPIDNLAPLLRQERVDEVIVALPWTYHRRILSVLHDCEFARVRARVVPDILRLSLSRVDVDDLAGIPLIGVKDSRSDRGAWLAKRLLDLGVVIITAPLWLLMGIVLAIAIRADSPGPVIFSQVRVGQDNRKFRILKFRSMREGAEEERPSLEALNEADGPLFKIRSDPRTTRVGRIIRRFSLDELPQVFNILRGEMSLVGPRPPLPEEVERYHLWHMQRLEVPPGLTGLAQVSGRSDLTFDEMVLLDVYYAERWSLWLDIQILLRTVPHILAGSGAY